MDVCTLVLKFTAAAYPPAPHVPRSLGRRAWPVRPVGRAPSIADPGSLSVACRAWLEIQLLASSLCPEAGPLYSSGAEPREWHQDLQRRREIHPQSGGLFLSANEEGSLEKLLIPWSPGPGRWEDIG